MNIKADVAKLNRILKEQDKAYDRALLPEFPILFNQISIDDLDNKEKDYAINEEREKG